MSTHHPPDHRGPSHHSPAHGAPPRYGGGGDEPPEKRATSLMAMSLQAKVITAVVVLFVLFLVLHGSGLIK